MGSDNSDEEDRERILAPDDLDITAQPEVEEIDDGRYVVSPDGPAKKPNRDLLENPDWLSDDDETETAPEPSDSPPREPRGEQSTSQPDEESTPRQPQPDNRSTPQAGGQNQQPPGNTQPGGQNQQSPNTQSGGRGQQSPTNQPTNRGQQSPTQSGGRKQQSSSNRSGDRGNQQSPNTQSGGRSQQSSNTQSSSRNQRSGNHNQQSTGGGSPTPSSSELAAHDQPPVDPPAVELTNANISKFLAEELTQGDGDYGFDATLNVEGEVNRGRMTSDDIGETLETLLRWYARQTTEEVEPESVLGIILAGSDLAVEYPVQSVYTVVKRHDLKPDDSISDLLAAVRKEGSFTVPPSEE